MLQLSQLKSVTFFSSGIYDASYVDSLASTFSLFWLIRFFLALFGFMSGSIFIITFSSSLMKTGTPLRFLVDCRVNAMYSCMLTGISSTFLEMHFPDDVRHHYICMIHRHKRRNYQFFWYTLATTLATTNAVDRTHQVPMCREGDWREVEWVLFWFPFFCYFLATFSDQTTAHFIIWFYSVFFKLFLMYDYLYVFFSLFTFAVRNYVFT